MEFEDVLLNETNKVEYKLDIYYVSGKVSEYKLPMMIDNKKSVQFSKNRLYLNNIERVEIFNNLWSES